MWLNIEISRCEKNESKGTKAKHTFQKVRVQQKAAQEMNSKLKKAGFKWHLQIKKIWDGHIKYNAKKSGKLPWQQKKKI